MQRELTIYRVDEEVHHKSVAIKVCAICGKNICSTAYKGKKFAVLTENSYGQQQPRYACKLCVKKFYKKELKETPERIQSCKDRVIYLRKRKKTLEFILEDL